MNPFGDNSYIVVPGISLTFFLLRWTTGKYLLLQFSVQKSMIKSYDSTRNLINKHSDDYKITTITTVTVAWNVKNSKRALK